MRVPLSWLRRHLDTAADVPALAAALTNLGLEVEDVDDPAARLAPFRVAEVTAARPHPQADKLQICTVRTREGEQEVVCGAPNARAGMKAILAPEGAVIPAMGQVLKKAKIRGVESRGMLVSAAEIGLSDDARGIIEAPAGAQVGAPAAAVLGLDDPVFDIGLTPNRGDCAGVRGVARDLAAAGLGALAPLPASPAPVTLPESPLTARVEDADACPLFCVREIAGVTNGPSPQWLQKLLKSAGLRPVSAVVDITNFFALDRARPLHAYDADALSGDALAVRRAHAGEGLPDALDGRAYTLSGGEVVICDADGIVALGGLMGGTRAGCTEDTTRIVLECAVFDPAAIAAAGRALGIVSEARYRFERGVDASAARDDLEAATRMILEVCGGQAGPVVQVGAPPPAPAAVRFDAGAAERLTGLRVDPARQADILRALGFEILGMQARPPPWRHDIAGTADLVEEVARVVGLDAVPAVPLPPAPAVPTPRSRGEAARAALVARGCDECVTPSFTDGALAREFGGADDPALTLENPIAADLDTLRPTPLPHLVAAAVASARRGHPDVALCEVGPGFTGGAPGEQEAIAAVVRAGAATPRHWSGPARDVDAFDAKADALAVLEACGIKPESVRISRADGPPALHPGQAGALRQGARVLGYFGALHPALAAQMDARGPVVAACVFLDRLPEPRAKKGPRPALALPEPQPVTRDFAFVVGADVEADALVRAVARAEPKLIERVEVFDVYTGLDGGAAKSIALAVTLQPQGKDALDEAGLAAVSQAIVRAAETTVGAALRA
jgi:phenylalanyl-tRNA synthetase beta chain